MTIKTLVKVAATLLLVGSFFVIQADDKKGGINLKHAGNPAKDAKKVDDRVRDQRMEKCMAILLKNQPHPDRYPPKAKVISKVEGLTAWNINNEELALIAPYLSHLKMLHFYRMSESGPSVSDISPLKIMEIEKFSNKALPKVDRTVDDYKHLKECAPEEYYDMMYDLIYLAFETNQTNVASFMIGSEEAGDLMAYFSARQVKGNIHKFTHTNKFEQLGLWDQFLLARFRTFLDKMSKKQGRARILAGQHHCPPRLRHQHAALVRALSNNYCGRQKPWLQARLLSRVPKPCALFQSLRQHARQRRGPHQEIS